MMLLKPQECLEGDIPIIGIIENMSYLLLEDGKKEVFGKDGAKNMSEKKKYYLLKYL